MASPIPYSVDDKDLDDAALWAVIDSAAASLSSSKSRKPLALKHTNLHTPSPIQYPSPPPPRLSKNPRNHYSAENDVRVSAEGEVLQEPWAHHRPQKIARSCVSEVSECSPLVMVKHVQRTPTTPIYSSPETGRFCVKEFSPVSERSPVNCRQGDEKEDVMRHSLSGRFPSVSLFKEYQNAAMAILEKSDYTMISGSPFIKKAGWRKISFYFNLSYEIKDKTIEFDDNRNVLRAEFVVRAYMQSLACVGHWLDSNSDRGCGPRTKGFVPKVLGLRVMAQQEDGWPLGLQPLNARVGLLRNRDYSGSVSFSTLLTASLSSSTGSSSDLDTQSTGSFFHDKSISLGSVLGVSSIIELSQRSTRGRTAETLREKKNYKSRSWIFSLCSKLTTDAVNMDNTPSLGHFLQVERRASSIYRRNQSPTIYGPDDFSQVLPARDANPLFISGQVAPPQSSGLGSDGRNNGEFFENGNGHGVPLLLSCLCGQLSH
ncbi:hypothetical protein L1049_007964 [Liquidambar formosana]|uniref:Uncharacterized protein n=1 Tax=Liquidambar formosana TaxID=63359 RepID=A0AAP0SA11_LIQFO